MEQQKTISNSPKYIYASILSPIGFFGGVAYAFNKKTGFWKGWGNGTAGWMGKRNCGLEKIDLRHYLNPKP